MRILTVLLVSLMVLMAIIHAPAAYASTPQYTLTATLTGVLHNYTRIVVISNEDASLVTYTALYTRIDRVSLSLPPGEYTVIAVSTPSTYYWVSRGNTSLGYATVTLSGDTVLEVNMVPVTEYSRRRVVVTVYYANDTPVDNAWVHAYTPYIWIPYTEGIVTYNHTRNGTAVLELYDIPYIISASKWLWLEISREWNETINIGGENYTVRCTCPHSIRLYGRTYIGPGETAANITLHIAREYAPIIYPYYPVYRGAEAYMGEETIYGAPAGYAGEPRLAGEQQTGALGPSYPPEEWMQPYIEPVPITSGGEHGAASGATGNETSSAEGAAGGNAASSGAETPTPYLPVESAIILSAGIIIAAAMISLSLILVRRH